MNATTKDRLSALVNAIIDVREDPAALQLLEEQLLSTCDGTGTNSQDLQHLFTTALAHLYAHEDVRKRDPLVQQMRALTVALKGGAA
jgi:hypothetical protein